MILLTPDEIRVLSEGPSDDGDYETVRRLCDMGLTDSRCLASKSQHHYGKVISVAWFGPNTAGKLALEGRLSASTTKDSGQSEEFNGRDGNQCLRHPIPDEPIAPKPESPLVSQAWAVVGGLVLVLLIYLVKTTLGIAL